MLVKVLKAFRYAVDVRTQVVLEPGQVFEIDDAVVPGLEAEGFIGDADAAEIEAAVEGPVVLAAPVEIPDDFADLSFIKLKPVAEAVSGAAVRDRKAAIAILTAELAARAGA